MHVVEERLGIELVNAHESRQRRAELSKVGLLQMTCVGHGYAELLANELGPAHVDLSEKITRRGIKRVVEIEDPYAGAFKVPLCRCLLCRIRTVDAVCCPNVTWRKAFASFFNSLTKRAPLVFVAGGRLACRHHVS